MKVKWNLKRRKEDLAIPQRYQQKSREMQNRRELSFLLQEAAFVEKVKLYHVLDLSDLDDNQKEGFLKVLPDAKAVIFLGTPIFEPLLLMDQTVFGSHGEKTVTMAQSQVENELRSFADKLETMGYQTAMKLPPVLPDPEFAKALALTRAGFVGKNQRFIMEDYGCRICVGYLLSDAPLMGGDYRDQDYEGKQCGDCQLCISSCPAGALSESGYDAKVCLGFREDSKHQNRIAAHSIIKCSRCMESCPIGEQTRWAEKG